MRVFLLNQKLFSEVNRKEELTSDSYLITDEEADLIKKNLEVGGYFWIDPKTHILKLSGPKPTPYSEWDEESHSWKEDPTVLAMALEEAKLAKWEEIKVIRDSKLLGGITFSVNGEDKGFQTDMISQHSYDRAKDYLSTHKDSKTTWKTLDNSFVELDYETLTKLLNKMYERGEEIFHTAELKRLNLMKLETLKEVKEFDLASGW